jgi:cytochrome c oxidase subunit 3
MSQANPAAAGHGHVHRDDEGAKIGMWLFLYTELILFGALFLTYAIYRYVYSEDFHNAAVELNTLFGTVNTLILLTSSLTMAMSITAIQKKQKQLSLVLLGLTNVFAFAFMVNKYFEWGSKFDHGIYFGSAIFNEFPMGEKVFFGLYYFMTGLHGLHIIIGIAAIAAVMWMVYRDKITHDYFTHLENVGLYWHIVDVIWIFLFPLFYLIK